MAGVDPPSRRSNCVKSTPHPADSLWSWLVLLCAFLSHVLILGSLASFGIFYPALLAEFRQDKAITALVDSLCLVFGGVLGPVTGKLTDYFGCRVMTVSAFLTCAVSFLTTSYAPNVYVMFATYSVLFGYVVSSIYSSVMIAVASQFNRKRSLALGLISAGFGAGIFTMSPIIQLLLDHYGLRRTYRVLAVAMTVSSLVGYMVNARTSNEDHEKQEMMDNRKDEIAGTSLSRSQIIMKSVFVNADLIIITLSNSLVAGMGLYIPSVHLAKYAEELSMSTNKVSQLYLWNGVLSMIGRVLSGYVLDKQCVTPKCYYTTTAVIGGIATLLLPLATTHVYLVVVNSVLGWVKGTLIATTYVIQLQYITSSVPKARQGQTFGVCNCVYYVIAAAGPSSAGLIADKFGSYSVAFYMAGAIELLGATLVSLTLCFRTAKKGVAQRACAASDCECLVVVEKVSVL